MIRLRNLTYSPDENEQVLYQKAEKALGMPVSELHLVRRSVDARKKKDVHFVCTADVSVRDEASALLRCRDASPSPAFAYKPPVCTSLPSLRPVIVGFGPAGMFAGLILAGAGLQPIILERGEEAEKRTKKIAAMRQSGTLDPESNIQFGEGGAGAFSDGKLTTGVKNPCIPWVLEQLVKAGAPEDILFDAKPHIGTDLLPGICSSIRRTIQALGGEVRFSTKLVDMETDGDRITAAVTEQERIPCSHLILACGHSARDTFAFLADRIPMAPKAFAMGVRIEHLQADTDRAQYGTLAGHPNLPPADYSLAVQLPNGRRCYSFCMCPGGEVVPAASEAGRLCINGASPNQRNHLNSNSALLTALSPSDFPYEGILGGMTWQRDLERRSFELSASYHAPVQTVGEFLTGRSTARGRITPSYKPGVLSADLHTVLPAVITDSLTSALPLFGRKLTGFDCPDAVMTAPETRSSSPVRMERNALFQSPALRGFYPCGEGAGWAGGIMSAALDGIKCAEALIRNLADTP